MAGGGEDLSTMEVMELDKSPLNEINLRKRFDNIKTKNIPNDLWITQEIAH